MNSTGAAVNPFLLSRKALLATLAFTALFLTFGFFSHVSTNAHLAWTFGGIIAAFLIWHAALLAFAKSKKLSFGIEYVPISSHYVQASVQFAIYVYWGWYWRNVYAEFPLIFAQLAYIYVLDGLFSWSRGRVWRLGFGPWPIVFSTNLFMWFRDDWFIFQFLMITIGFFGKQYIRWERNGKNTHIFNPSALGLTTISLILIFTGTSQYTWGEQIALTQGLPPHLYTEIFLCGLVVQFFFGVTLLTFSAAAMLGLLSLVYFQLTHVYLFVDSNIPIAVFLGLHLLMTDPATTPRYSLGKILFGSLYAGGVFVAFILLEAYHAPSFYDKLIIVPILNLLTPALDRLVSWGAAGRFAQWEARVGARKMNIGFMSCWIAVFFLMLSTDFVEGPHPGATIGFWKKAAEEKRPHAIENLRALLYKFNNADLDDPTQLVGAADGSENRSREQTLGILCNQVGSIYFEGKLVPGDQEKAAHFFARACDFGNSDGCANLANQYLLLGRKEAQPYAENAISRLEKSALDATNGAFSFIVGYSYDVGRGHPENKTKARQYYQKGADLGDLNAERKLAGMLLKGEGGPVDHAAAARWLQRAVDANEGTSCMYLAQLYHNGDGVPKDEARATALLEKACGLGVQPACQLLQQKK